MTAVSARTAGPADLRERPGVPIRLERADPPLRVGRWRSTAWTSTSPAASSSPCSARRAAARRRRCGRSPASTGPTAAGCCSTAGTSPTCPPTSATWAWCSRPTACSRTSPSPRTWPSGCGCAAGRKAERRGRAARAAGAGRARRPRRPLPAPALRRPAAAGGAGPRAGGARRRCCCSTSRCRRWTPRCGVQLREEIRRIQLELGITTVFVTHDQAEALSVADRVGVMRAGRLEQVATPGRAVRAPGDRVRRRVRRHDEPGARRPWPAARCSCWAPAVRWRGRAAGRWSPWSGPRRWSSPPTPPAPGGWSPARSPAPRRGCSSPCPTASRCGSTCPAPSAASSPRHRGDRAPRRAAGARGPARAATPTDDGRSVGASRSPRAPALPAGRLRGVPATRSPPTTPSRSASAGRPRAEAATGPRVRLPHEVTPGA